jgi:hypothetical protein
MSFLLNLDVLTFSYETMWLMTKYCYVLKSCGLGKRNFRFMKCILMKKRINFILRFIVKMWKRDKNNNGEGGGGFNNPSSSPILISLICPIWFPIIHHDLCQFLSYNMNIKGHMLLFILLVGVRGRRPLWSPCVKSRPKLRSHILKITF